MCACSCILFTFTDYPKTARRWMKRRKHAIACVVGQHGSAVAAVRFRLDTSYISAVAIEENPTKSIQPGKKFDVY